VSNAANASVQVGGVNQAPISARSTSNLSVKDVGVATAQSGSVKAVAEPKVVTAADEPSPSPSSDNVTATGLNAQVDVTNTFETSRLIAGGPANKDAISITQSQTVSVTSGGSAAGRSGAVCDGSACGVSSAPATSGGAGAAARQAVSGAAEAQGLDASNTVTTEAKASVSVAGRNFAPIRLIVDALTNIQNWGSARAVSGAAVSSGGAQRATVNQATTAASGTAQATGAQVRTRVNLSSSASVRVEKDNYNPINIILKLAANFLNWGVGDASSGNATTRPVGAQAGGASMASSGASTAAGLQTENVVNLQADASVVVEGDNYAPISVWIRFDTELDNRGWADASTGNAQATAARATGGTTSPAAPAGTVVARGGSATTTGDSVKVTTVAQQSANANGAQRTQLAGASAQSSAASTSAPSPTTVAVAPTPSLALQSAIAPTMQPAGAEALSGPAAAGGMRASVELYTSQVAACTTPESGCSASNAAGVVVRSNAAPAVGPPVPTIPPPPAAQTSTGGPSDGRDQSDSASSQASSPSLNPDGATVMVNPWSVFPGRRLPPPPKQTPRVPPGTVVGQNLWAAQAGDELPPMPGLFSLPGAQPTESVAVQTPSLARAPTSPGPEGSGVAAPPVTIESELEPPPPLTLVHLDPWSRWPRPGWMPVPNQVARAAASSMPPETQTAQQPATPAIGVVGDSAPLAPVVLGALALGALVGGSVWRWRIWLADLWLRLTGGAR